VSSAMSPWRANRFLPHWAQLRSMRMRRELRTTLKIVQRDGFQTRMGLVGPVISVRSPPIAYSTE
jgi:hypothetical protein